MVMRENNNGLNQYVSNNFVGIQQIYQRQIVEKSLIEITAKCI